MSKTPPKDSHFLPSFLYGEDSFEVEKKLKRPLKAIARGKPLLEALKPVPIPESLRSSVPIVMKQADIHPGFHIRNFGLLLFDSLFDEVDNLEVYKKVEANVPIVYRNILAEPWGVLCSLPYEGFVWIVEGDAWKDQLSAERILLLLQATQRESAWLRSLDGRFEYGGEKPNHLWDAHTVIAFLAARNQLPLPNSWASWDATITELLEKYSASGQT